MKIRIAYTDNELEEKNVVRLFIQSRYVNVKVHETGLRDGFRHTYLTFSRRRKSLAD